MDVVVNFFASQSTPRVIAQLFAMGGWVVLAALLLFAGLYFYVDFLEERYKKKWKYVLLAVDIPQLNIQTPMAVEQMFSHLAGAFEKPNVREKYWRGYKQRWFSLEIISIEGYIQFLIWTESLFQDLMEGAVYAQYPEAEIVEVEDYVGRVPSKYPSDDYDIWIADFGLAESDAYPLRSYREFEHSISKDTVLKDPMGTFLESFSRIGKGEQMWFQILVEPRDNSWKQSSIKKIKEMIGDISSGSGGADTIADYALKTPLSAIQFVADTFFSQVGQDFKVEAKPERVEPNQMRYLTPGQSKLVEAMEAKIAKIGFKTKIRGVYAAEKAAFQPARGVHALLGAVQQFNVPTSNSLTAVSSSNMPTHRQSDRKKTRLMAAYKKRKMNVGGKPFMLNIEELATIWHFPMSHVKTPLVQKAATKPAEPPTGLPVDYGVVEEPEQLPVDEVPSAAGFYTDTGEFVAYD